MPASFEQLAISRRSIYALGRDLTLSHAEVTKTIQHAIKNAPSAFNSQSSRALILFGEQHHKLWELVREQLRKLVAEASFSATSAKIDSFSAAAGCVLFFEDQTVVAQMQQQFPSYAANFPVWSEHSTGIAQYAVWLALAEKNIGANLQHYNPLIDEDVKAEWNIPASWQLRAQLNFGSIQAPAGEKTYIDDNERFIVAGQ